ncbi:MAG: phosphoglycerate kinase [Candidatus Omnitrophica bacterium]|nr:phosphoglycerate kinase [Candidatus Omnitrophota bacterium]
MQSLKENLLCRVIIFFVAVTFILGSAPVKLYADIAVSNSLRATATSGTSLQNQIKGELKKLSTKDSDANKLEVRRISDLRNVIKDKGIDSGICIVDWNVPRKGANLENTQRIEESTNTIISTLNDTGLRYLYVLTHSGRPKNIGYEEEFSLKPIVDAAKKMLAEKGLKDAEIVLLPYDLSEAEKVIRNYKENTKNGKIIFVTENIRFYPEEQLKAEKTASDKDKANIVARRRAFEEKLIAMTGRQADKLIYVDEAFDKAHRGEEASMEMAWLIPEENRAAGIKFAADVQAVLDFQSQVSGSLNTMAGGAKFDKYKQFGDLAGAIAKTGGKLMLVGAQANPYLKTQGKQVGKSLLPKAAEQKDVDSGIETIKKSGAQILLPSDFIVAGKESSVKMEELALEDAQIDIGDESIKEIVSYINSLKKGDGLILNGGAGVFDRSNEEGGSKKGTVAIVVAANEAAKRGVAVFFAGGDMNNALEVVKKAVPGFQLDSSVRTSTGGGSLLTALAKGVANLAPVRAVIKMDVAQSLALLYNATREALPEAILCPTFATYSEDTSINGSDANRRPELDVFQENGIYVGIPDGSFASKANLYYDYVDMPIAIFNENLPAAIKDKIAAAKDEKAVTAVIQEYLKGYFNELGVRMASEQQRSAKLDAGKLGAAAVDMPSLIALKSDKNDVLIHLTMWVKRDHKAVEAFNAEIMSVLNEQVPELAKAYENPLAWSKEAPDVSSSAAALKAIAKYAPLFFDEFSKGDLSHSGILTQAINNIKPEDMLSTEGIKYDSLMGVFTSVKDDSAKTPGFGKNLEKFLSNINDIQREFARLYTLATPAFDSKKQSGVAVNNKELQDAVLRFYSRMSRYLTKSAINDFNDARVFESAKTVIGDYAQRLNKAIRANDAIEINGSSMEAVANHLAAKGVVLSQAEKDSLAKVYARFAKSGGVFAYDILQVAGIFNEDNFVAAFRNIKVDAPKKILPSQKLNEAYDGTGRIGRIALAMRLTSDISAKEPGYVGRYLIRTRELKGKTDEEKFASAAASANEMISDAVIKDLEIVTPDGSTLTMEKLISAKRITFSAENKTLAAELDFQTTNPIQSIYPVDVLLDGQKAGVIYFADVFKFSAGLTEELKKENVTFDNMPRPILVREDDGKTYYFGLMIDATNGGVDMGDQAIAQAVKAGKVKIEGPTVWDMAAKGNLAYSNPQMGDAPEELRRYIEIIKNIEDSRLSKGNKEPFIYLKAQIANKLLLPMGGGIHFMGRYLQKLPFVKESGAMYFTPTSCSTNGASYISQALANLFGGLGQDKLSVLGITFHMYTSGSDKSKGTMGDLSPKSTGAAKGVKQNLDVNALFTALRTPTAYEEGTIEIVGGSIFDFLVQLPSDVSEDVVRKYLSRVGAEFSEDLKIFTEKDKVDGRYRWENTITGQRTGSIVYEDYIKKIVGKFYRMEIGYDNEVSYSYKLNEFIKQLMTILNREKDAVEIAEALAGNAPLADKEKTAGSETKVPPAPKTEAPVVHTPTVAASIIAPVPVTLSAVEFKQAMQSLTNIAYKGVSAGYENVMNTVKETVKSGGTIVIGANAILDNATSVPALKNLKDTGSYEVVVWAQDKAAADALKAMGVDEAVARIMVGEENGKRVGLETKIAGLAKPVMLIASPVEQRDIDMIKVQQYGVLIETIEASKAGVSGLINSMPLAISRAVAILADNSRVTEAFKGLSANYKGKVSEESLTRLNSISKLNAISSVPLVQLSAAKDKEVLDAERAYKETTDKL